MRAVVQRVTRAEVRVDGRVQGRIGAGLVVLAGVGAQDTLQAAESLAKKVLNLRILDDGQRRMNRSMVEAGGGILCVSQFTLCGDARHGRRPSYTGAASPAAAKPVYEHFVETVRCLAAPLAITVESGQFQAMMEVELVNDGPVTVLLDTEKAF
ncbi:MAG: D-aminoacyl-tRNA deacylase [Terriglobia bacterium]